MSNKYLTYNEYQNSLDKVFSEVYSQRDVETLSSAVVKALAFDILASYFMYDYDYDALSISVVFTDVDKERLEVLKFAAGIKKEENNDN